MLDLMLTIAAGARLRRADDRERWNGALHYPRRLRRPADTT